MDEKTTYDEDINSFKNDIYTEKMLKEKLLKRYENLEEDNKKLSKSIELITRNNDCLIDKINNLKDEVTKDQAKIRDMLNEFNDDMDKNMNNLYEKL